MDVKTHLGVDTWGDFKDWLDQAREVLPKGTIKKVERLHKIKNHQEMLDAKERQVPDSLKPEDTGCGSARKVDVRRPPVNAKGCCRG